MSSPDLDPGAWIAKDVVELDRDQIRLACVAGVLRTLVFYRRMASRGVRASVDDKEDSPPDYSVLDRNLEGLLGECAFKKRAGLELDFAVFDDVDESKETARERRNRRAVFRDPYDAVLKDGSTIDVKTTMARFGDGTLKSEGGQTYVAKDREFKMFARTDQPRPRAYVFYVLNEGQNAYSGTRSWCRDAFRRCVLDEAKEGTKTTRDSCLEALDQSVVIKMNPHFLDRNLKLVEAGWCAPGSVVSLRSGASRSLFSCVAKDLEPIDGLIGETEEDDLASSLDTLRIA